MFKDIVCCLLRTGTFSNEGRQGRLKEIWAKEGRTWLIEFNNDRKGQVGRVTQWQQYAIQAIASDTLSEQANMHLMFVHRTKSGSVPYSRVRCAVLYSFLCA